MLKTFIILKYFHIQTSAIKRKYPTLIVRIFFVSACTHSISTYIHIQTLCVHKRNVLRFLQHGTYHVVVRGGSHFCQSPKGGGVRSVFIKTQGRANTFLGKKSQNSPALPPPKKKRTFPNSDSKFHNFGNVRYLNRMNALLLTTVSLQSRIRLGE